MKSKQHFLVKRRIFKRWMREIINENGENQQKIIDAWNLSDELVKHSKCKFLNEIERQFIHDILVEERNILINFMNDETMFKLGFYL